MDQFTRDREMKKYYLDGKSRQETMRHLGITNTNSMSSASSRLGLHWSWPFENRRSGIEPLSAQTEGPRKPSETGGGLVTSIMARASRVTGPANLEVDANAPLYETPSPLRRNYGQQTLLSERQKHERGYDNADLQFGGRLSPFPTPSEVSNNPNDLTRAEIHAIAALYRG